MTAEILPPADLPVPTGTPEIAAANLHLVDYEYAHGNVEVHGAKSSYTVAVPLGELASSSLIVYENGLCAFKKTMRKVRNATAGLGDAGLSSSPIRRSNRSPWEDLSDPTTLHIDRLAAIIDDLPNNAQLRDNTANGSQLDFSKVNLACHSYGGITGVRYALRHPDNVANLVLIKPAGQEKPELLRFLPRVRPFFQKELLPYLTQFNSDYAASDIWKALKHIYGSPLQTLGETAACVRSDHRFDLWELGEKMGIALITGEKDNLIPAAPIEALSAQLVHRYEKLSTDHLGPQRQPHLVAQKVIEAVRDLDAQRAIA